MKTLLSLLILFFFNTLQAQNYSSFKVSSLNLLYTDSEEDSLFHLVHNSDIAVQKLFIKINNYEEFNKELEWTKEIEEIVLHVQSQKKLTKKTEKLIEFLKETVDKRYLQKYMFEVYPYQMFTSGYFNCLTGTWLYANVYSKLGFPVEINILPNHVNLSIKDHEDVEYIIESTAEELGYLAIDREFMSEEVRNLNFLKVITDEELKRNSIEEIYNKYYGLTEKTNMRGLLAFMYSNHGIYLRQKGFYRDAIHALEKSLFIHPFPENIKVYYSNLYDFIFSDEFDYHNDLEYFIQFMEITTNVFEKNDVADDAFKVISQTVLIENQDAVIYDSLYQELLPVITADSSVHKLVRRSYAGGMLSYHYTHAETNESDRFLDSIYIGYASDLEIQNYILESLRIRVVQSSNPIQWDSITHNYEIRFPEIIKNETYQSFNLDLYLAKAVYYFTVKSGKDAIAELNNFQDNYHENLMYTSELVAEAYGKAVSYYYNRNNVQKARDMVNQGLMYAPDDKVLLMKKSVLNNQ